ncbi:hypothetical protein [Mesorhizobium sp. NZP2077]|uniref:hypothetical protein n=1 Tax=Mesorhizobium sp. NZP2077 TaxID=2483404 RepID=UPI001557E6E3|nr:hypothetical protein [Mesorhizobium sp. NZP2077]QKC85257.1 hypothetical protein EB232_30130 [Mesorhizobium sp. NZP2077]QKD18897.1 hypothetical protein HGP13_29825 [Mesorhizobium sp. NZP2077]
MINAALLIVVVQQDSKFSGYGTFYNQFLQTNVADARIVDATPDYSECFRYRNCGGLRVIIQITADFNHGICIDVEWQFSHGTLLRGTRTLRVYNCRPKRSIINKQEAHAF